MVASTVECGLIKWITVLQRFDALPDNLKGATILVFAAVLFTLGVALIKYAGERLPVIQLLFLRQLGMLVMLSPALASNFPENIRTHRPWLQLIRVVFALIALLGGFTAVVNMPLAEATALGFAKSFFVTVFAVLILKERVGPYRWGAIVIGFIGVALMLKPGTSGYSIYGIYAIAGAASAGLVMVIIRLLSKTETSTSIIGFQVFGVGLVTLIPAMMQWVAPTPLEWLIIVAIGVISFFAQKANIYAYKHGEASLLASLDYVRLLFATVLGYFLFQQLPQLSTWLGAGIIIVAAVFTVYRESKREQTLTRAPGGRGFNNT